MATHKEHMQGYRKRKPYYNFHNSARSRCLTKGSPYNRRGIKYLMTLGDVRLLWCQYLAYKLARPSIDRINRYGNYTFKNCRFIELSENLRRKKASRKGGINNE